MFLLQQIRFSQLLIEVIDERKFNSIQQSFKLICDAYCKGIGNVFSLILTVKYLTNSRAESCAISNLFRCYLLPLSDAAELWWCLYRRRPGVRSNLASCHVVQVQANPSQYSLPYSRFLP